MNQILEAKLAASCGNVVAFLTSKCRRDAIVLQDAQKAFLDRDGGTLPVQSLDLIVRDEVDFGPQAPRMADESACLVLRIIEASNEDILQSERLTLTRAVILTSIHKLAKRILSVDRHDLTADLISGGVERNGQANLQRLIGEFNNARNEPTR